MYASGTFVGTTLHCVGERKKKNNPQTTSEGTEGSASWQRTNLTDEGEDSPNTGAECLCFACAPIKIDSTNSQN